MEPYKLLGKYYFTDSSTYSYLVMHSRAVAALALKAAERVKDLNPDMQFIEEAALLHDIAIFKVNAPTIGCIGPMPYIRARLPGAGTAGGGRLSPARAGMREACRRAACRWKT